MTKKSLSRRTLFSFVPAGLIAAALARVPSEFDFWFAPFSRQPGGKLYDFPKAKELRVREDVLLSSDMDHLEMILPGERMIEKSKNLRDLVARKYADGSDIHAGPDAVALLMFAGAIKGGTVSEEDDPDGLFVGRFLEKNRVYLKVKDT